MKYLKEFDLNNGHKIPSIGFGTWQISNEDVTEAVLYALKCGYRHIDTAIDFGNENGVGHALKISNVDRKEIYLTSKIPAHIKTYEQAKQ